MDRRLPIDLPAVVADVQRRLKVVEQRTDRSGGSATRRSLYETPSAAGFCLTAHADSTASGAQTQKWMPLVAVTFTTLIFTAVTAPGDSVDIVINVDGSTVDTVTVPGSTSPHTETISIPVAADEALSLSMDNCTDYQGAGLLVALWATSGFGGGGLAFYGGGGA